jgi:transposase
MSPTRTPADYTTWARYDTRPVSSSWQLRLATFKLVVKARLRRLACPVHGVRVEGVDFARPSSRFTRDFEQLVAWPAVKMVQDALWRLVDIDWDSVGRICDRVVAKRAPGDRRCHAQVTDRKGPSFDIM